MLVFDGVAFSYGDHAVLRGVDLSVDAGRIVALLGPNGAGKTTLVQLACGLLRPSRGSVVVAGRTDHRPAARAEVLGVAPQDLGLYPMLSVRENLRFFARLRGLRGHTLTTRLQTVAEDLELGHLLDREAGRMSSGEKRRLHTAIALLHRPPLLLLDEPTVGADVESRDRLIRVVKELAADGTAVLYSTHYLAEVEALDARVAMLDRGRIVAQGSVAELRAEYAMSHVELRFRPPLPEVPEGFVAEVTGDAIRVAAVEPGATAAALLSELRDHLGRLESISVFQPSLETVFRAVTGRPFTAGDEDAGGRDGSDGAGGSDLGDRS